MAKTTLDLVRKDISQSRKIALVIVEETFEVLSALFQEKSRPKNKMQLTVIV